MFPVLRFEWMAAFLIAVFSASFVTASVDARY
jgi:hypothetical protein